MAATVTFSDEWKTVAPAKAPRVKERVTVPDGLLIVRTAWAEKFCKECNARVKFAVGCSWCGKSYGATRNDVVHLDGPVFDINGNASVAHCTPVAGECDMVISRDSKTYEMLNKKTGKTKAETHTFAEFKNDSYTATITNPFKHNRTEWVGTKYVNDNFPGLVPNGCICMSCLAMLGCVDGVFFEFTPLPAETDMDNNE
jgi:hypothetical protein